MEFIKSKLKKAGEFLKKFEKKKLIITAALIVVVIAAGIIGAVLLNRTKYAVLYSDLSAQEAGTIINLLKDMNVDAKAEGTSTIKVPVDQADEIRIELAAQGYPNTGLNYDLFSDSSNVGSTDLERQTYLQYQLQENMRTTICRMAKVKDCIVIVNLASTSSFVITDNSTDASVAVLLSLKDGQTLTNSEAKTIGVFVLKCVPKLKIENVSIVDSDMNYYNITDDSGGDPSEYSDAQQQLTEKMKEILMKQALCVLEPAIGAGNVAVSVNLSLDFDKQTVNSVEFSPPIEGDSQGLLISSQEKNDSLNGASNDAAGEPGTASNGVSSPEYVSGSQGSQNSQSSDKTYNYELNQIQTQIEKAKGSVQDLSVAVLINSNVDGISNQVDTIKNLVANSIGADSKYISVELMPFVQNAKGTGLDSYFQQNQQTISKLGQMSLIKTVIIAAALLLAIFIVTKFILNKRSYAKLSAATESDELIHTREENCGKESREEQDRLLQDLMTKKSDETEKMKDLMDKYPEAVVQTLRTWLVEDE